MTIIEFARVFLDAAPVAVVMTDAQPRRPGPTILYANAAFGRLTGREVADVVGLTPRFMQGRETRRSSLDAFARALVAGDRFHGYLTNYRGNGEKYRVEIDCRPLRGPGGSIDYYISFEREVRRRIGRPAPGMTGRYEPVSVDAGILSQAMLGIELFHHAETSAGRIQS